MGQKDNEIFNDHPHRWLSCTVPNRHKRGIISEMHLDVQLLMRQKAADTGEAVSLTLAVLERAFDGISRKDRCERHGAEETWF